MGLFSVREGRATRDFVNHKPTEVWAALLADPLPEELARWGIDHYERFGDLRATYRQRGKVVEARFEVLEPEKWLRSVSRVEERDPEVHEFTLRALPMGGVRLEARVRLAFAVRRGVMRQRLSAMLDGIALRVHRGS